MNLTLDHHINDYVLSSRFTILSAQSKALAEPILQFIFTNTSAEDCANKPDALTEKIYSCCDQLNLTDNICTDIPRLIESFFTYLGTNGIIPEATEWCNSLPKSITITQPENKSSSSTVQRSLEKIGRNDPCPCGSGIKFKKCCIELLS